MSKCSVKYQQLEYVDGFQNIPNYNQISPYKVVAMVTEDRRRELFKNLDFFMKVPTYLVSQPILKMFKQNTLQMKMFEITIFLAFFTENLVKLHLKFVEQCPIDQNARSSCEVTLSLLMYL